MSSVIHQAFSVRLQKHSGEGPDIAGSLPASILEANATNRITFNVPTKNSEFHWVELKLICFLFETAVQWFVLRVVIASSDHPLILLKVLMFSSMMSVRRQSST